MHTIYDGMLTCYSSVYTFFCCLQDSGGELVELKGGIQDCRIQGLNTGTLDLQVNGWGHKVHAIALKI
jgi:hypothetical protein